MSSYVLILRGRQYSALLNNAALGNAAHTALLEATRTTATRHHAVLCENKSSRRTDMRGRTILPQRLRK